MANIKSAKKRILTIEKKTQRNKARKSAMKTAVKGVYEAAENNDLELAKERLNSASRIVNKTASKGTIHKNKASRLVSRMNKRVQNIGE